MAMGTVSPEWRRQLTWVALTAVCAVGSKNKHCLCATCERKGRGGYSVARDEEGLDSQQVSDSDEDSSSSSASEEEVTVEVNINERRTRRGVYHVLPEEEDSEGDDSDTEVVVAGECMRSARIRI